MASTISAAVSQRKIQHERSFPEGSNVKDPPSQDSAGELLHPLPQDTIEEIPTDQKDPFGELLLRAEQRNLPHSPQDLIQEALSRSTHPPERYYSGRTQDGAARGPRPQGTHD